MFTVKMTKATAKYKGHFGDDLPSLSLDWRKNLVSK